MRIASGLYWGAPDADHKATLGRSTAPATSRAVSSLARTMGRSAAAAMSLLVDKILRVQVLLVLV